jgi:hypothetical protein
VGFCGGQSGAGVGFLRVLRFPLPIFIPPIAPKIILIYHRGLYNRPKRPQYQGLRYLGAQSHPTNNNKKNMYIREFGKCSVYRQGDTMSDTYLLTRNKNV